jgi:serine protease AprX
MVRPRPRLLGAAVALAAALPSAAHAAAPAAQLAQLRAGTAVLQAEPDRLPALRSALTSLGARLAVFPRLEMVAIRGNAALLRRAGALAGVRYAHMDHAIALLDHQSTPLVYDGRQQALWQGGFDGRGVRVAIVDSGVDGLHPDLTARVVRNTKIVADLFTNQPAVSVECPSACTTDTSSGHGTHVAGIVAGDGTASSGYHMGVAPGTDLVGYGTGDGDSILWALAAFDDILAHPELNIRAVNNSWGPLNDGTLRADFTAAVPQATKKLHDAGITVVFAAGNDGTASNADRPPGASKCDQAGTGDCRMNIDSVQPWVISVAASRDDMAGGAGGQGLAFFSSRGDPQAETSLDGTPNVIYQPALAAPGVNILSARAPNGSANALACASAEPPACQNERPEDIPQYVPLSGTSMASPQVAGAVAVVQSAAKAKLGRYLTPDDVKTLLRRSATPMTRSDLLWDWPCGTSAIFVDCGTKISGMTGAPYQAWHAGAGMLDVARAVDQIDAMVPPPAAVGAAAKPGKKPKKKP